MPSAVQLTEKGHVEYKAGNYASAIDFYDKALVTAKLPAHLIALQSNRAACFLKQKNYAKAAEACSGVLQLDPSHEGVLLLRARTLQALKEFKTALFDCDRLVQLKPDNATYTALQLRLRAQMADSGELSSIVEHDASSESTPEAPPTSDPQRRSDLVPSPRYNLAPVPTLQERPRRNVGFGAPLGKTGSPTPQPSTKPLNPALPESLPNRPSATSPSSSTSSKEGLYSKFAPRIPGVAQKRSETPSPKSSPRTPIAPTAPSHEDLNPKSFRDRQRPSALTSLPPPTFPQNPQNPQNPQSRKVVFDPELSPDPSENRPVSPVGAKLLKRMPTSFPSRTASLPSPSLPHDCPSHRVVFGPGTHPDPSANPRPLSPIAHKIMNRIPTPFAVRDESADPRGVTFDSDPDPETDPVPVSPVALKIMSRQLTSFPPRTASLPSPLLSSPWRTASSSAERGPLQVGFAPNLSIHVPSSTADPQPPSPIGEKIKKRAETPHHWKPPSLSGEGLGSPGGGGGVPGELPIRPST